MNWIDTHCHLESLDDPQGAAQRAREAGVSHIVAVAIDLATSIQSVELSNQLHGVWAAVGLHPHEASSFDDELLSRIAEAALSRRVVAIGEIGLDYYRDNSPREVQIEAFRAQLQMANRLELPAIIHVRESQSDAYRLVAEAGPVRLPVFHCFSGSEEDAEQAARMGYVSFAGNISFKNAGDLRRSAAKVALDRLVIETDSPYLAPVPYRGRPNEPAYSVAVGRALAEAVGVDLPELARITTENAMRAFGLT